MSKHNSHKKKKHSDSSSSSEFKHSLIPENDRLNIGSECHTWNTFFGKELKKSVKKVNYKDWFFFSHDWFVYFFARLNHYKVVIDKNAYILYSLNTNKVIVIKYQEL